MLEKLDKDFMLDKDIMLETLQKIRCVQHTKFSAHQEAHWRANTPNMVYRMLQYLV